VETIFAALEVAIDDNQPPVIEDFQTTAALVGRAAPGDEVQVSGLFSDADLADTHTVLIDWGDGTSEEALVNEEGGVGEFSGEHEFETGGVFIVTATVTDGSGASVEAVVAALVTGVGLGDDSLNLVGTRFSDSIVLERRGGELVLTASFLSSGGRTRRISVPADLPIVVLLGDGHDVIVLGRSVANPTEISLGSGNDVARGSAGPDEIHAGAGRDIVFGLGGGDLLFGDAGSDFLFGGDGPDELNGGEHGDHLFGERGADALFGDGGADWLFGLDGNDLLSGGDGDDWLFGGRGADELSGDEGVNRLFE
jgi:Ca2+-binding RTX toxin-like protein